MKTDPGRKRRMCIAAMGLVTASLAVACQKGKSARSAAEPTDGRDPPSQPAHPNLAAARWLDQEGIRCFREGRYQDAVRYFQGSYRFGGPSSELWNVARSRERLDDPEGAVRALEGYIAQRDLSPQERADAEREARALRARPSMMTIATTPAGASIAVDGHAVPGATPLSFEVAAGVHAIGVRLDGYSPESRSLEASFGHAVIVSLDLVRVRNE